MEEILTAANNQSSFIFDENNPRSLINIVSDKLSKCIQDVPKELLDKSLIELEAEVKPSKMLKAVKVMFWREVNRAQMHNTVMVSANVWRGACHENTFYNRVLPNPKRMAWLLIPNMESELELKLLYDKGMERLEEIVNMDIRKQDRNEIDPKKAEVIMKAIKMIADRVNPVTQKIEQKQLKVSISDSNTKKEVQHKIEEMKKKIGYG